MAMNPTLSIITINFNNCKGLQKTIDSVVPQSFRDFEWIVIDGGSSDGSRELIERSAIFFSYWVSEPDKGIYNAMNKGIKVAKGDYLLFLNSGDWLYDDSSLERCFSHSFTSDIVYGDFYFVKSGGQMVKSCFPNPLTLRYLYCYSLGHNASFIKRELLQKELYDERFKIVSDWAFFLKQAMNICGFEYIDEIVSCFDTNGISSINKELVKKEREAVLNELIPDMLVQDYQTMDDMEAALNKCQVKKVIEYGGKSKLYHKMITGVLMFIGFLDRHK
ncbi:MAG: glycosyltransferase [Bacteroidales bacterium]|nr:glycosyltransferase [Bacteroidales bacterium]